MGKLVVTEFITLDGVFEDPGGAESDYGGWAFKAERGEDGEKFKADELRAAEAQLLGRITYEGFAQAWPKMQGDWFGQKMNEMPKYVMSNTLQSADWNNSHVLRGELAETVGQLKQEIQGDILTAGSGTLVRGLLEAELVDELRLMVCPVVLGRGRRLFGESASVPLKLVEAGKAADTASLVYRRQ